MSRMPRTSTGPEVALRRELHARGIRFRLNRRDLPGTPDLVLPSARIAVFVDGCFWHGCPAHGTLPKNNREWWRAKLEANVARDRRKDAELEALGWTPVHVWEHQPATDMADVVEILWRRRRNPSGGHRGERARRLSWYST
jgi:DNA mismatch endonuclease (patch repair protein)